MEQSQVGFINDTLNEYLVCPGVDNDDNTELYTRVINSILSKEFTIGPDMHAVEKIFMLLFAGFSGNTENGLRLMTDAIRSRGITFDKISVRSREGFIYVSDIFSTGNYVAIKVPRKQSGSEGLLREYFVGIMAVNHLRNTIPTFVYTLGAFRSNRPTEKSVIGEDTDETLFVVFENVPGKTIDVLLKDDMLPFEDFLSAFAQLLIALEVAQQECEFTHFDLHGGNVILKPVRCIYDVQLDTCVAKIDAKFVPVIIDFGFTTVKVKGKVVGSGFRKHGMIDHMVPGYDMYKFLVYSYNASNSSRFKARLEGLFAFYGTDDVYDIEHEGKRGVEVATNNYCGRTTYSKLAMYTPRMFLDWILDNYEVKGVEIKNNRSLYIPIHQNPKTNVYKGIENVSDISDAIMLSKKCVSNMPSYVMTKYMVDIFARYNINQSCPDISEFSDIMKHQLEHNRDQMIEYDIILFGRFRDITVPTPREINRVIGTVLGTLVHSSAESRNNAVKVASSFTFAAELRPYLEYLFAIREVGVDSIDVFRQWADEFTSSRAYRVYSIHSGRIEQMLRWARSLDLSLRET